MLYRYICIYIYIYIFSYTHMYICTYSPSSSLCSHSVPWLGEAYIALSSAIWYPSSSRLVRLSNVSPVFL